MGLSEAKLVSLFDFQKFIGNPRLAEVIGKTEAKISSPGTFALEDDDIDVWAAGDLDSAGATKPEIFFESDDDEN